VHSGYTRGGPAPALQRTEHHGNGTIYGGGGGGGEVVI